MYFLSKDQVVISELFLQPTYDCASECLGCYVKANVSSHATLSLDVWREVFLSFYAGRNKTQQISISLDCIPVPEAFEVYEESSTYKMISILSTFARETSRCTTLSRPEIHGTVKNLRELKKYLSYGVDLSFFDAISISNVQDFDRSMLHYLRSRRIKLNLLLRASDYSLKSLKSIRDILSLANVVGFVMNKPSMNYTKEKDLILSLTRYVQSLRIPAYTDVCMIDSMTHCSAGKSKFTIWPDGSVSGCPYKRNDARPASSYDEVMENLLAASNVSWISNCIFRN